MTLLEWQHWTVFERVVDGDTAHLLPLQVELAAVAAVVVFVVQAAAEADSEAVELVFAVVMLPAAEAETRGVEWTEPVSQSAKHKANENRPDAYSQNTPLTTTNRTSKVYSKTLVLFWTFSIIYHIIKALGFGSSLCFYVQWEHIWFTQLYRHYSDKYSNFNRIFKQ